MLSVCILTRNSSDYIEKLLRGARAFADEIVIAVDGSSTDSTERICRKYADKLFRLESVGNVERVQDCLYAQCNGDWILRLDDDELPSTGLVKALPLLMKDREITHYWIPTRWVIRQQPLRWIAQRPWWPDWHNRLFRNIPSIIQISDRIHTMPHVLGASRYFCLGCIYHLDLVYHSEEQRRQKVARYEQLSPGKSLGHYYFPDEGSLKVLPIPTDDRAWTNDSRSGWREMLGKLRPSNHQLKKNAVKQPSMAELCLTGVQECDYNPELFKATLDALDCPGIMVAGEPDRVDIDLRNDSDVAWALTGRGVPEVRVSYHWLRESREAYQYDGSRTVLPHTLRPGEKTRLSASIVPPEEPGSFILQWDLVIEQVSWFSNQGWLCPEFRVQVIESHALK